MEAAITAITDTTDIVAIMDSAATTDIADITAITDTVGIMAAGMAIAAIGMDAGGPTEWDRAGAGRRTTIALFGSATDAS